MSEVQKSEAMAVVIRFALMGLVFAASCVWNAMYHTF